MQHRQSSKDRAAGEIDIFILKNGETVEIRQPSSPRSSYVRLLLGGQVLVWDLVDVERTSTQPTRQEQTSNS